MVYELIVFFLSSLENREVPWKMLEQKYTLPSGVHIMAWDFCTLQHSFKTMSSNERLSLFGGREREVSLVVLFPLSISHFSFQIGTCCSMHFNCK